MQPVQLAGGAYMTADRRRSSHERIAELEHENARLEQVIEWQQGRIEELAAALAHRENWPGGAT